MSNTPNEKQLTRLTEEKNIWVGTVRPDGRPHLTPVWFAFWEGGIYICISSSSVKARNLAENDGFVCALEDGSTPIIAEGRAESIERPYPEGVVDIFIDKYEWDIRTSERYDLVVRIKPEKWLGW